MKKIIMIGVAAVALSACADPNSAFYCDADCARGLNAIGNQIQESNDRIYEYNKKANAHNEKLRQYNECKQRWYHAGYGHRYQEAQCGHLKP